MSLLSKFYHYEIDSCWSESFTTFNIVLKLILWLHCNRRHCNFLKLVCGRLDEGVILLANQRSFPPSEEFLYEL